MKRGGHSIRPRAILTALQVEKSIYDYVVYDSEVEREFAQKLDQRDDIRLFVKLPDWFKVETPVSAYNPDWAIVKHGDETLYLVRETKATKDFLKLRTTEVDKVRSWPNVISMRWACPLPWQQQRMTFREFLYQNTYCRHFVFTDRITDQTPFDGLQKNADCAGFRAQLERVHPASVDTLDCCFL